MVFDKVIKTLKQIVGIKEENNSTKKTIILTKNDLINDKILLINSMNNIYYSYDELFSFGLKIMNKSEILLPKDYDILKDIEKIYTPIEQNTSIIKTLLEKFKCEKYLIDGKKIIIDNEKNDFSKKSKTLIDLLEEIKQNLLTIAESEYFKTMKTVLNVMNYPSIKIISLNYKKKEYLNVISEKENEKRQYPYALDLLKKLKENFELIISIDNKTKGIFLENILRTINLTKIEENKKKLNLLKEILEQNLQNIIKDISSEA